MVKTIESEILDVYDAAKRKRDEDDQAYWARLVQISVDGTDEQWHQLEAPAQEWINAGVRAKKQNTEYIPFPDAPAPEPVKEPEQDRFRVREVKARPAAEAAPAAAPAPERRRRTRTTTVKKPAPEPVAAAPAPQPAAKEVRRRANGKKPPGVYAQTQEYVVRNPNASTKDIMKALEKKGLTAAQHTVQSVRGHTRDTLKLVQRIKQVDMGIEL